MSAAVVLPVEIGDNGYRLSFKFGTVRIFERELGKTISEAFGGFEGSNEASAAEVARQIPMDVWSALFWSALHPAHMMTREGADDLIDEAGLGQVVEWCLRGLAAYNAGDPSILTQELEGNVPATKAGKQAKTKA